MAITVRYPGGQAVRYNAAYYVLWSADGGAALYTAKDGRIVARVLGGSGAIVEFEEPCTVSNPLTDRESALKLLLRNVRQVSDGFALAELKRALASFNARTHTWKAVKQ